MGLFHVDQAGLGVFPSLFNCAQNIAVAVAQRHGRAAQRIHFGLLFAGQGVPLGYVGFLIGGAAQDAAVYIGAVGGEERADFIGRLAGK